MANSAFGQRLSTPTRLATQSERAVRVQYSPRPTTAARSAPSKSSMRGSHDRTSKAVPERSAILSGVTTSEHCARDRSRPDAGGRAAHRDTALPRHTAWLHQPKRSIKIDAGRGSASTVRALSRNRSRAPRLTWVYLRELNRLLLFAAGNASLEWTDPGENRTLNPAQPGANVYDRRILNRGSPVGVLSGYRRIPVG